MRCNHQAWCLHKPSVMLNKCEASPTVNVVGLGARFAPVPEVSDD